ncbi:hypothetical protein BJV78DRAFT_1216290, partial [Lactifluus subvellereus]
MGPAWCNGSISFTMFPSFTLAVGFARQRRKRRPRSSPSSSSCHVTNSKQSVLRDGSVGLLPFRWRHPGTLKITGACSHHQDLECTNQFHELHDRHQEVLEEVGVQR